MYVIKFSSFRTKKKKTKITTVTKYTNRIGNRHDDTLVTSTVFNSKASQKQFNSLNDAQFRGTLSIN